MSYRAASSLAGGNPISMLAKLPDKENSDVDIVTEDDDDEDEQMMQAPPELGHEDCF